MWPAVGVRLDRWGVDAADHGRHRLHLAINLEVPYRDVVIAAVIPSILYFFALFMQIDGYAARNNLEGLPKVELAVLEANLKDGWYYVAVFVLLIYLLVFLQREAQAPFCHRLADPDQPNPAAASLELGAFRRFPGGGRAVVRGIGGDPRRHRLDRRGAVLFR